MLRLRDPLVDGGHQLQDRVLADIVVAAFERGERRTGDDRNIVAVEVALRKFFADFELDEFEQLGIVERSEEHTSELQSLMRSSYAVFCLKKKNKIMITRRRQHRTDN